MTSTAQPAALSAEEMLFADRTIAAHSGRPGRCSESWSASRSTIRINSFPPTSWSTSPTGPRCPSPRSTASSPSTRSSTWSRRATTPSASAAAPPATRAARATCCSACAWSSACPRTSEDGADKLCLTTPDRRYSLRTVACFGQCALAPVVEVDHAHLRPHERAGAASRDGAPRARRGKS